MCAEEWEFVVIYVMAAAGGGPSASTPEQVKLDKECELRVEVSPDSSLRLRLLSGTAEIFGTEIPPQIWLSFPPSVKFAVSFLKNIGNLL